jgi:hypothetical protein
VHRLTGIQRERVVHQFLAACAARHRPDAHTACVTFVDGHFSLLLIRNLTN